MHCPPYLLLFTSLNSFYVASCQGWIEYLGLFLHGYWVFCYHSVSSQINEKEIEFLLFFFLAQLVSQFFWHLHLVRLARFSRLLPLLDLIWSLGSLQYLLQLIPQKNFFFFTFTFGIPNYIIIIIIIFVITQNHFDFIISSLTNHWKWQLAFWLHSTHKWQPEKSHLCQTN